MSEDTVVPTLPTNEPVNALKLALGNSQWFDLLIEELPVHNPNDVLVITRQEKGEHPLVMIKFETEDPEGTVQVLEDGEEIVAMKRVKVVFRLDSFLNVARALVMHHGAVILTKVDGDSAVEAPNVPGILMPG